MSPDGLQRIVIGIGGLEVCQAQQAHIVTFALGSCIGVTIHDPSTGIGGMLHAQLPTAAKNPERARSEPGIYVDSGIELLFKRAAARGANLRRLRVAMAGAATVVATENDIFNIARQNLTAIRKAFWKMGVLVAAEDTGGTQPRTLYLDLVDGSTSVVSNGRKTIL